MKFWYDQNDPERSGQQYGPPPPWWYFQMMNNNQNQNGPQPSFYEQLAKQKHEFDQLEKFFKKEEKAKKTLGLSESDLKWVLGVTAAFCGWAAHSLITTGLH